MPSAQRKSSCVTTGVSACACRARLQHGMRGEEGREHHDVAEQENRVDVKGLHQSRGASSGGRSGSEQPTSIPSSPLKAAPTGARNHSGISIIYVFAVLF